MKAARSTKCERYRSASIRADKPFNITKKQVYEAYKAVKSNGGAAGADGQTIEQFDADLQSNLHTLWNRMSSGSYFPPPVRAVPIPKKSLKWRDALYRFGAGGPSGRVDFWYCPKRATVRLPEG
jgi:retron-type reverse transcriptase